VSTKALAKTFLASGRDIPGERPNTPGKRPAPAGKWHEIYHTPAGSRRLTPAARQELRGRSPD
jgi:hypothetical protein